MKVALVGGTGQLGRALHRKLGERGHAAVQLSRSTNPPLDASDGSEMTGRLSELEPDAVVHLAAITDVTQAQRQPEAAWRLHAEGARHAARWCQQADRPLIYVSTDAVFDGTGRWYTEEDEADPLNAYATTKFLGERSVLSHGGTVVRCNFLGPGAGSLVASLFRRLKAGETVVGYLDAVFSPLHVEDLSEVLCCLVEDPVVGLLHVAGEQAVDKHSVACLVCEILGSGKVVAGRLPQDEVRRPCNTTLCSERARRFVDIVDRGWEQTVRDSVAEVRGGDG
jgi:dTDP-4-dehydrorhamnose reductase